MTESEDSPSSRPISVAELLARNGTIGAPPPVGGRRRRRRGNADAVTVAELTGEIPVVTDTPPDEDRAEPEPDDEAPEPASALDETDVEQDAEQDAEQDVERDYAEHIAAREADDAPVELEPRRPRDADPARTHAFRRRPAAAESGAEQMSPDPLDDDEDLYDSVDLADAPEIDYTESDEFDADAFDTDLAGRVDVRRSRLRSTHDELFGGPTVVDADDIDLDDEVEAEDEGDEDDVEHLERSRLSAVLHGAWVVVQCLLAVAFGAGLFLAFDRLWQWNGLVTLVLAVLVSLGLAAAVRVIRKSEDFTSTMTAVAVGILVTFGPLALQLQTS